MILYNNSSDSSDSSESSDSNDSSDNSESNEEKLNCGKNNLTPPQPMGQPFCDLAMFTIAPAEIWTKFPLELH